MPDDQTEAWRDRYHTAESLRESGDPAAVPQLLVLLADDVWNVRVAAAAGLGQLGGISAVQPLIGALADEYGSVRVVAAEALGLLGDPRAVGPLIHALSAEEWPSGKARAAEALGRVGDAAALEPLWDAVRSAFRYEDWELRRAAATAMARLGTPEAQDRLFHGLQDPGWHVASACALGAGECGLSRAAVRLSTLYLTADPSHQRSAETLREPATGLALGELRRHAVRSLGLFGSTASLEVLRSALRDPDGWVRSEAVRALARLSVPSPLGPLCSALWDSAAAVRQAAAEALGSLGRQEVLPQLRGRLRPFPFGELDGSVRQALRNAIETLEPAAVAGLPIPASPPQPRRRSLPVVPAAEERE
jgi:HEAT repeat protein